MSMRKIIHVDMDAFYASVEQRDNPELRGKAVIVGGKPNGRGVVAACSYEARAFGVHSAMPSAEAGRRCPQAVFVKPRFEAYQAVSRQIQAVFREFTSLVEPLSLDEAYLDVTGNTLFDGSALLLAREIKALILERTDLVASAGVSYNKFLAKIASDHDKPDGLFCIRPEEGAAFAAALAIGKFHGIGKVTESRMHELDIFSGADLRHWCLDELESHFGKNAQYYYSAARGIDDRPVRASRTRKSIGSERTFSSNIESPEQMLQVLRELSGELLEDLQDKQLAAATLNIKVRFGDFDTLTRSYSPGSGFVDNAIALRTLPHLLEKALSVRGADRKEHRQNTAYVGLNGVRLLGVSFSSLQPLDGRAPRQLEFDLDDV
ncbi:MAG: DNA polymerase IV [Granulosicoccus sp.]